MAFVAVADVLQRFGWSADDLRWLYAVKIVAVLAALFAYRRSYTELAWRPMGAVALCSSIVVGIVVLVLWVNLDAAWMLAGESAGFNPTDAAGRIDWVLVAVRIAGAALVVPVMEELFWRSFLQRWVHDRQFLQVPPGQVGFTALIVTSLLFGVEHNQWFAGVVAGLAYGVLYMRTGTLWAPILAHAVTNGLLGAWVVGTGAWTYW
ncbi:hypothetical protein GCM10007387_46060 [Pseudoduganella albidiflava]|nr:hypothetical protein GCM10007387_46060 [Pseudoduganella albidiflava]